MKNKSKEKESQTSEIIVRKQSFGVSAPKRAKLSMLQVEWKSCPELEESTPSPESGRRPRDEKWGTDRRINSELKVMDNQGMTSDFLTQSYSAENSSKICIITE